MEKHVKFFWMGVLSVIVSLLLTIMFWIGYEQLVRPSLIKDGIISSDSAQETIQQNNSPKLPKPSASTVAQNDSVVPAPPPVPRSGFKTFSLLPGQSFSSRNREFRKIHIRAEYPVKILTGPCTDNYTVDFSCDSDPADIFITDTRNRPIFVSPKANSITISGAEF
jgi:hypothetical protein